MKTPAPNKRFDFSFGSEPALARMQWTILLTMYVGYAAFMLCRNTLIASSAEMIEDPNIDLDLESYGQLMSWHSAGAIAGKLVTGVTADKIGGRRMFLWALLLTAAANLGFAFCSSFVLMGMFHFLGQFFKAGGWPAMTKIVPNWFRPQDYGRVWSIISTSSRVGTILAGVVLGFLLSHVSWRMVFVISAVVTGLVVVAAYFLMKEHPTDAGYAPPESDQPSSEAESTDPARSDPHPLDNATTAEACRYFAASLRFWLISFSVVFLTILMEFLVFVPAFLAETIKIDTSKSAIASAAFPAGMFVALIASAIVYDRLSKRQLVWVLGGLMLWSAICVIGLWSLPNLPIPAAVSRYAAIALIFAMGFGISPAYYIPMSIFSISFGGKHSGMLVATLDIFGYAGSWVFSFFGGSIAQNYGWPVFLSGLLSIALLATTCMTVFLQLEYRKSLQLDP